MVSRKQVQAAAHRLLPTASQQLRESPGIEAMARTFATADAMIEPFDGAQSPDSSHALSEAACCHFEANRDANLIEPHPPIESTTSFESHKRTAEESDPVDIVMSNLDQFLGSWDLEADLAKARASDPSQETKAKKLWSTPLAQADGIWDTRL